MAKVTVHLGVEVEGLSVHLVKSVESGNPLFHAKEMDRLINEAKEQIGSMVVSAFGDVRGMK